MANNGSGSVCIAGEGYPRDLLQGWGPGAGQPPEWRRGHGPGCYLQSCQYQHSLPCAQGERRQPIPVVVVGVSMG